MLRITHIQSNTHTRQKNDLRLPYITGEAGVFQRLCFLNVVLVVRVKTQMCLRPLENSYAQTRAHTQAHSRRLSL